MMKSFQLPDFLTRSVELRCADGEVMIYGTVDGLQRLAKLCIEVAAHLSDKQSNHIHLEDYELLTDVSLRGTVGAFADQDKSDNRGKKATDTKFR